jgi:hypothetical protein
MESNKVNKRTNKWAERKEDATRNKKSRIRRS